MGSEGFYFIEPFTEDFLRFFRVEGVCFEEKTKFQLVHCFRSRLFGKILFLDKKIQSAEVDEFVYHESLVHPALITHPHPKKVLILGGGEGATLREVLKHRPVETAVMVDIDEELVKICQEILPEWSQGAFANPKTKLIFQDARLYVQRSKEKFDVILSDLTEPLRESPSLLLFTKEFFEKISFLLKDDGLFVLQAGSTDPHYNHFFASCARTLQEVFPVVRPYWTFMFSFSLPWGFILASQREDPLKLNQREIQERLRQRGVKKLKFYHSEIHSSSFALPLYLKRALKRGRVLTDKDPFVWEA